MTKQISSITRDTLNAYEAQRLLGFNDFGRGDVGFIIGEAGCGKSTFSVDLAARIARGGNLYDEPQIPIAAELKVRILAFEHKDWDIATQCLGLKQAFPDFTEWEERFSLERCDLGGRTPENINKVTRCMRKEHADVYILDNWQGMFGTDGAGKKYAEKLFAEILQTAEELNAGVFIVNHTPKTVRKGVNSGYGSSALGNMATLEILLTKYHIGRSTVNWNDVSFHKRLSTVPTISLVQAGTSEEPYFVLPTKGCGNKYWTAGLEKVQGWKTKEELLAIIERETNEDAEKAFLELCRRDRNPMFGYSKNRGKYAGFCWLKREVTRLCKELQEWAEEREYWLESGEANAAEMIASIDQQAQQNIETGSEYVGFLREYGFECDCEGVYKEGEGRFATSSADEDDNMAEFKREMSQACKVEAEIMEKRERAWRKTDEN